MAIMTRSEIIAQARRKSGRQGQEIDLNDSFNAILKKITRDYPALKNICHPFTTVANQSFVPLPSDYRLWDQQQCFYGDNELDWIEPEEYFRLLRTFTDTASSPSKFTAVKGEGRLYLWNKPSVATLSHLYYAAIHPKVDRSLSFTLGSTEITRGDTVTGATSGATMVVSFIKVTSGSWVTGDAAGRMLGAVSATAFQAENLNIGATLNVATVAGAATITDSFQHFLGEDFDEVIIEGVTWKCMELLSGKNAVEKALMKDKKKDFEDALFDQAGVEGRQELRSGYRGF